MSEIAELIDFLQDADLDSAELKELVKLLTSEGMTEPVRRKVRSVLAKVANKENQDLEQYEKALDIVEKYDADIADIMHKAEQKLKKIDMETNATLDTLQRKTGEDVDAAKGGATLLIHSEDVVPATAALTTPLPPMPAMSPKEAAAAVLPSARMLTSTVSPTSSPAAPIMPANEPLPVTMTPLPSTPIAPPAVTEPAAA